jgi:hypothetical protein
MSRGRYLHHITLTTGYTRRSYRDEVEDDAVTTCRWLLDDALDQPQEHVRIPRVQPACTITATQERRALIVTIWGPPAELRGSAPQRPPLATFGVATHSRSGAKLWRVLHETECRLTTSVDQCPPEPWIAARIEIGAVLMPEAMEWMGDFERCIAHAWLERDETRKEKAD